MDLQISFDERFNNGEGAWQVRWMHQILPVRFHKESEAYLHAIEMCMKNGKMPDNSIIQKAALSEWQENNLALAMRFPQANISLHRQLNPMDKTRLNRGEPHGALSPRFENQTSPRAQSIPSPNN